MKIAYKRIFIIILLIVTDVIYGIDNTSGIETLMSLEYPLGEFDSIILGITPRFNKDFQDSNETFIPIVAYKHKFNENLQAGIGYRGEIVRPLPDENYTFRHLGCIFAEHEFDLKELNSKLINKTRLQKISVETFTELEYVLYEHGGENSLKLAEVYLGLGFKYPLKESNKLYAYNYHAARRCIACKEDRGLLLNMYRTELGLGYNINKNIKLEVGYSPRYNIYRDHNNRLEHQLSTRIQIKMPK